MHDDASGVRRFADLEIDVRAREVTCFGEVAPLTRTEYELLLVMIDHAGQALTREQILARVWGDPWFGDTHLVSVHMSNLRRKIRDHERVPPLLHTLHGVGYRFGDRWSDSVSHSAPPDGRRSQPTVIAAMEM